MIIISRVLLPKLGWQINVANHIKNQRRRSIRLATVMFRGTPCISGNIESTKKSDHILEMLRLSIE